MAIAIKHAFIIVPTIAKIKIVPKNLKNICKLILKAEEYIMGGSMIIKMLFEVILFIAPMRPFLLVNWHKNDINAPSNIEMVDSGI